MQVGYSVGICKKYSNMLGFKETERRIQDQLFVCIEIDAETGFVLKV
jgi:hypothetical protein